MGMMVGTKMDMFYSDERSEEQYQKAKEHLIRLLRKRERWQQHEYGSKADTEAD